MTTAHTDVEVVISDHDESAWFQWLFPSRLSHVTVLHYNKKTTAPTANVICGSGARASKLHLFVPVSRLLLGSFWRYGGLFFLLG